MQTSTAFQDELVNRNMDLVKKIAHEVHKLVKKRIDIQELINLGTIGLIESARRYDPERGNQFGTFAYYRVKGAMFDGVRDLWFEVSRVEGFTVQESANRYMKEKIKERKKSEEKKNTAHVVEQLQDTLSGLAACYQVSSPRRIQSIPDERAQKGFDLIEVESDMEIVKQLMQKLPEDLQDALHCIYMEDMSLDQYAKLRGRSKSWASRMHVKSIDSLKSLWRSQRR